MLFSILIITAGILFLYHSGIFTENELQKVPFLIFMSVSLIIGTITAAIVTHRPLAPIRTIMDATDEIANGNYDIRVEMKGLEEFRELGNKFNHMAAELGSVEVLRNDFVNNFSHEFKTPIVSIRGFAKMLKREDLTPSERNEYLDIIIEESERLTDLATNVLNLSKIEQQSILTNVNTFNVSEQIRLVIALLDHKLSEKNLSLSFESDEFFYTGDEELLKQVWINLLDNAIKFSPENGIIDLGIHTQGENLIILFKNTSEILSEETLSHLFDRFFQGDLAHSVGGNGLGLTLVQKIVELHHGHISVFHSDNETITFKIELKKIPVLAK